MPGLSTRYSAPACQSGLFSLSWSSMDPILDPDVELMLRVKAGDRRAFDVLIGKYQKPLINLIGRYLGAYDDAEDLAQEVFVRVHRAAPRYQPTAKFSTWLYTIARRLCA